MHVLVSWDINEPASANWNSWNDKLKAVLQPYAWVRPLKTVYVVPIQDGSAQAAIGNALTQIASQAPSGSVHVLVSPPMIGGQYAGYLPSNLWSELNKRST